MSGELPSKKGRDEERSMPFLPVTSSDGKIPEKLSTSKPALREVSGPVKSPCSYVKWHGKESRVCHAEHDAERQNYGKLRRAKSSHGTLGTGTWRP